MELVLKVSKICRNSERNCLISCQERTTSRRWSSGTENQHLHPHPGDLLVDHLLVVWYQPQVNHHHHSLEHRQSDTKVYCSRINYARKAAAGAGISLLCSSTHNHFGPISLWDTKMIYCWQPLSVINTGLNWTIFCHFDINYGCYHTTSLWLSI